ncbi:MAG: SusC/RagA family TonB-linked outer membrane protein [Bacteroidales bacterium]
MKKLRIRLYLAMSFSTILINLVFIGSLLAATPGEAQNIEQVKVNIAVKTYTLKEFFSEVEQKSAFSFVYLEGEIDLNKSVTISNQAENFKDLLQEVATEQNLLFKVVEDVIVVKNAEKNKATVVQQKVGKPISGVVRDDKGQPIPGVTVVIKGTTQGTLTDINGKFLLSEVPTDAVLAFSFVGMQSQEVKAAGKSTLDIRMKADAIGLDEVVAVGYGTVKKEDITGSVAVVSNDDIDNVPAVNVQESLVGKVAGAFVTPSQGANPSGGISIRIRGTNSLNESANSPLYVVDGVPMMGDLVGVSLDPQNIESISVLKDASSTAIYGARAAAGVILVTTKSGKIGKRQINASIETGVQTPSNYYDVINGCEFYDLFEKAWDQYEYFNPGQDRNTKKGYTDFYTPAVWDVENQRPLHDVEWQKTLLNETARWNKYSVSFSGGEERFDYYLNVSKEDREGIFYNTFFDRLSVNGKFSFKQSKKIKTGMTVNFAYTEKAGNSGLNNEFGSYMPTVYKPQIIPMYHPGTSDYVYASQEWKVNPDYNIAPYRTAGYVANNTMYDNVTQSNVGDNSSTLINMYLEYRPIKELSFRTNVSGDFGSGQTKNIQYLRPAMHLDVNTPNDIDDVSTSVWFGKRKSFVLNEIVTYTKALNEVHNLDLTGVFEIQSSYSDQLSVTASGSTDNDLDQISNQPTDDVYSPNGNLINKRSFGGAPYGRTRLASYMARLSYNYDRRYFITGTIRTDGSSKFAIGNKWGTFGAVAASWHVHNEDFFNKDSRIFSSIKPRISYGTSGNQASVSNFLYIPNVSQNTGVYGNILNPGNLANASLTWETVRQFNAGLDFGLFSNRLNIVTDFYIKTSVDMLGNVPIPISSGYGSVRGNLGSIENKGFELSINSVNIDKNDFTWTTDFTFSLNRNKILDLGENPDGSKIDEVIDGKFIRKVGAPVSNFYLYSYDGVWQLGQEDDIYGPTGHNQVGLFRVKDRQAEGEEGYKVINVDDRRVFGTPLPTFFGGFTNIFRYKNLSLTAVCTYTVGNKLFNGTKMKLQAGHRFQNADRDFYNNHWSPTNPTNDYQKLSTFTSNNTYQQNANISSNNDHWVEDASYVRLNNLRLNYMFSRNLCSKIGLANLSVSVQATNLFTITKYSGLDPAADSGFSSGSSSRRGIDIGGYPPARTYMMSLKVGI